MDNFTVADICVILEKSKAMGVIQLKVGTLECSFLPPEPKIPVAVIPSPEQLKQAKEYENEVFLENESRIKRDQLENLRLSDPEAFEDLVNRGELNAGQEPDGTNT